MVWQTEITVGPFLRGFHIVTNKIKQAMTDCPVQTGICHVFIKHTSASLTINENADPSVRRDFRESLMKMVPENASWYTHTMEGPDDMPAHIKSSLLGTHLQIPVSEGRLNLGTWQGVYIGEHRTGAASRQLVITVMGE